MKQPKKTITKRLRLSDDEWNLIHSKLKETDLSFSSFALKAMLEKELIVNKVIVKKINSNKDYKELLFELSRIGGNLNQISKYCNTKKQVDEIVLRMIKSIEFDISEIVKKC